MTLDFFVQLELRHFASCGNHEPRSCIWKPKRMQKLEVMLKERSMTLGFFDGSEDFFVHVDTRLLGGNVPLDIQCTFNDLLYFPILKYICTLSTRTFLYFSHVSLDAFSRFASTGYIHSNSNLMIPSGLQPQTNRIQIETPAVCNDHPAKTQI